jgi:hypothetical protein
MSVSNPPSSSFESSITTSIDSSSFSAPTEAAQRQPTRAMGTWTVGGLNPFTVKALTVVGFAIPVIGYLVLLQHYQLNALVGDQWYDVPVIRASFIHFPDWTSLWGLHNGNRILFPNLIVVALAHTVHYNIEVEQYLGFVMLLAATALFIFSHKRRSPDTPLLFYCPIAFLTLTFVQWQNTLWGFQIAWYLVLLSLAATIALLDRPTLTPPTLVAAAAVAVVGSYSSTQGLLIWPVGLVLLYLRGRRNWTFVSWIAVAAATAALYFYNFGGPGRQADNPHNALGHPGTAVKFFIYALGDVAGVQPHNRVPPNGAVMAFGVVILALAVLVLIKWGTRRDEHSGVPIGIALIIFGLLFGLALTEDRVIFGLSEAAQSRYTTNDILVLVGIYMTTLKDLSPRAQTSRRDEGGEAIIPSGGAIAWVRALFGHIDRRVIRWVAIAAIVIQVGSSVHYGPPGARQFYQTSVVSASLTRNIDHESDKTVSYGLGLFIPYPPSWFREQAQFLREHHLSLFG